MCINRFEFKKNGEYKEDTYKGKKGDLYTVDIYAKCGNCEECRNEKSNNWVIRNYYEAKAHDKASFITLTYKENTFFLIKKDFQNFMKRFRKKLAKSKQNCRVFYAGEYGTRYKRPHFHAIIYGWEEDNKNLKYLGINEKGNIILQSKTVDNAWGMGRTTYQLFERHEIPYITLYESAYAEEKYEYILSKKKAKELLSDFYNKKPKLFKNKKRRLEYYQEISNALDEMEKNKQNWKAFKEFNGWSKALGWEEFEKEYNKHEIYDWQEYIEDKEFSTPTSWIKKLANKGDNQAIEEMLRRAEYTAILTLEETNNNARAKQFDKRKGEKMQYIRKKDNTIL